MIRSNKNYFMRQWVIIAVVCVVGLIYIVRLFSLQIINESYKHSSESNVQRHLIQYPSRGKIYDRKGELLVYNEASYDLMVIPRQAKNIDTLSLCKLLNISKADYIERMTKAKKYSWYKPSIFFGQITKEEHGPIAEVLYNYHGFYLQTRIVRNYTQPIAAHILGEIGEVSRNDLKSDKYYKQGDYIGKSGIEKYYENELRGKKGIKVVLVDVHNLEKGSYRDGIYDTLPIPGRDIQLGIDAELQAYGEHLMQNKIGSIVALDPKTGQILALVTSPTYDPNLLVGRVRGKNYSAMLQDTLKPLVNRAISGTYPPGSTFKMVNGLIALQSNSISPRTKFICRGTETTPIKCTHFHASQVDLANAIENSCNPYFWEAYRATLQNPQFANIKEGYDYWYNLVRLMGFGSTFKTDIPFEVSGNIPTSQFFDKLYNGVWNAMTVRSLGIGQGEILVTPLQLANFAAIVGNEGYYYPPHFIKSFYNDTLPIDSHLSTRIETGIKPQYFKEIKSGMRQVFEGEHGTARWSKIKGIEAAGKTGTAENPHGDDHSIFIAFAPVDDPQIAIAVIVENAGFGSTYAAPIASLMMEKYIRGTTDRGWIEKRIVETDLINKKTEQKKKQ